MHEDHKETAVAVKLYEPRTRPNRKELGSTSGRRPQGVSSHRGIHVKLPFAVRSRGSVTAGWLHTRKSGSGQGVVEVAELFHCETERGWLRHAAQDAKSGDEGRGGRG